jgi:hypothetical protein
MTHVQRGIRHIGRQGEMQIKLCCNIHGRIGVIRHCVEAKSTGHNWLQRDAIANVVVGKRIKYRIGPTEFCIAGLIVSIKGPQLPYHILSTRGITHILIAGASIGISRTVERHIARISDRAADSLWPLKHNLRTGRRHAVAHAGFGTG